MASTGSVLFESFLAKNRISVRSAAKVFGVSHASVIEWKKGSTRPNPERWRDIDVWTAGAVPADSWLEPGEEPPRKRRIRPFARVVQP